MKSTTLLKSPGAALLVLSLFTANAQAADAAAEAAPQVKLTFEHPEKFVDANDRGFGGGASKTVLRNLENEFRQLGKRYLKADQTMEVTVTDVDLAGQFEPGRGPGNTDLRIVRASGWPRIDFRYVVKQAGVEKSQGKESLKDLNFQQQLLTVNAGKPLAYESRLLEDWFRKTFEAPKT